MRNRYLLDNFPISYSDPNNSLMIFVAFCALKTRIAQFHIFAQKRRKNYWKIIFELFSSRFSDYVKSTPEIPSSSL